jgi:D-inositol-3-phosphate glycosyltransferase
MIAGEPAFSKYRNVAFVCFSTSLGGLELSMLRLATEFQKRGANCFVIVPAGSPLADHSYRYGLRTEFLSPLWKYGDITASLKLLKILKRNRIDLVTAMQSKDINILAAVHTLLPSVKLVFYQEMQSGIRKRDFIHTWMYSKLSLWVTLTARMRQEVLENTRMLPDKIRVIPIGTDTRRFDPVKYDIAAMRDKFGIPGRKIVTGVLGRLDRQKGQEEFIRAIPPLIKKNGNLHFVIAGDESPGQEGFREYLRKTGDSLGVSGHLQFLPFTDEVPEFLSTLDIFLLPSYSETFGFVLIEAMSMQKPVVATDSGGVPEIITDGVTGLLVPPRNPASISNALDRLIGDGKLRSSLSARARSEAVSRFDLKGSIDELVRVYEAIQ